MELNKFKHSIVSQMVLTLQTWHHETGSERSPADGQARSVTLRGISPRYGDEAMSELRQEVREKAVRLDLCFVQVKIVTAEAVSNLVYRRNVIRKGNCWPEIHVTT